MTENRSTRPHLRIVGGTDFDLLGDETEAGGQAICDRADLQPLIGQIATLAAELESCGETLRQAHEMIGRF
jgi:hypothetical protein